MNQPCFNMEHKIDHTIDIEAYAAKLAHGMSLENMRERDVPKFTPAVPITERGRLHMKRVAAEKPCLQVVIRDRSAKMDFETAKKRAWSLFQLRAAHISELEDRDFNWSFSDNDKKIIAGLIRYFINDPQSPYPLNKGIFAYGLPGTGKTEVMQIMKRFCDEYQLPKAFEFTSMSETYVRAKTDAQYNPIEQNIQLDRCLDEFLRHTGSIIRFGEGLDINEAIIEARYQRFRGGGQLTHVISNATTSQVQQLMSSMISDRVFQMCTSVYFQGESKRSL